MLMSAFFKDIFQQNFKIQKSVFKKYNRAIQSQRLVILLYCSSLYFSSIRRIFSYLKRKNSNNSN